MKMVKTDLPFSVAVGTMMKSEVKTGIKSKKPIYFIGRVLRGARSIMNNEFILA